jgi:hypothetical protein
MLPRNVFGEHKNDINEMKVLLLSKYSSKKKIKPVSFLVLINKNRG